MMTQCSAAKATGETCFPLSPNTGMRMVGFYSSAAFRSHHFSTALTYVYNGNSVSLYNTFYISSRNVHPSNTYSFAMYQWKNVNKTLKIKVTAIQ